jgi:hypothetical protein
MRATTWQRIRTCGLSQAATLLAAAITLAACASVPIENPAEPAQPANYGKAIAEALRKFKDFPTYRNFQISGLRWVHAPTGWNWLICVRYDDRGQARYYSFFLGDDNTVANARYDVRIDRCPAQQYVPFDATTGTVGVPTPVTQQPIY